MIILRRGRGALQRVAQSGDDGLAVDLRRSGTLTVVAVLDRISDGMNFLVNSTTAMPIDSIDRPKVIPSSGVLRV